MALDFHMVAQNFYLLEMMDLSIFYQVILSVYEIRTQLISNTAI